MPISITAKVTTGGAARIHHGPGWYSSRSPTAFLAGRAVPAALVPVARRSSARPLGELIAGSSTIAATSPGAAPTCREPAQRAGSLHVTQRSPSSGNRAYSDSAGRADGLAQ